MTTVGGLPAHVLLVHAVVVLVPLTALLTVLVTVWPAARRRLTVFTAVVAVLMVIIVPVTTEAGEWLERRVDRTDLVRAHTELGDTMLPWAIGLAVVALAVLARELMVARGRRRAEVTRWGGRPVSVALAAVAVIVAVGSVVTDYRIGDSGARAAWTGQFSQQAQPPPSGGRAGAAEGSR